MRHLNKYILFAAVSLDGKISENSKKIPDWTSREDWKFFQKELSLCDAVVVGRKTFVVAKQYMKKRRVFVLTHKATKGSENTSFINPVKNDLKKNLSQFKRVAIVGGSTVYAYAIKNKLADELFLTVEPVILGSGIPFIKEGILSKKEWVLMDTKVLNKKGSIILHYMIK